MAYEDLPLCTNCNRPMRLRSEKQDAYPHPTATKWGKGDKCRSCLHHKSFIDPQVLQNRLEDIEDLLDFGERDIDSIAIRVGYAHTASMLNNVPESLRKRLVALRL